MKIYTPVARACKKLLAFIAESCSVKIPDNVFDTETSVVLGTECNHTPVNKPTLSEQAGCPAGRHVNYISNDPAAAGPFYLAPVVYMPKNTSLSSKTSIMKQISRCMQTAVKFFTSLVHHLSTGSALHKKNKSWKMKVAYVSLPQNNTLPSKNTTMRNSLAGRNAKNIFSKTQAVVVKTISALLLFSLLALISIGSFGQTAGPNIAGNGVTSGGSGTAWTNPGNITANDGAFATVSGTGNAFSEYLHASNFGFNIPAAATINGISVTIGRKGTQSFFNSRGIEDNTVQLMKAGSTVGNNKAASGLWPTSVAGANYGATNDLWGQTWGPSDINATDFGVALRVNNTSSSTSNTASVDYISVTITYTCTLPSQPSSISGAISTCSGVSQTYSVTNVSGVTYNWALPAGWIQTGGGTTNSITVTTGNNSGNISVTPSNSCGSGTARTRAVTINPNASITSVTTSSPTMCIGGTSTATANGAVLGGGTGAWGITGGNTINGSGIITGVNPGPATVTYTITGGCGGTVSQSTNIFVLPNSAVASVTGTSPLCVGSTSTYTANGQVQSGGTGSWSSDNTSVATVDPAYGTVTAVGPGTANIKFTITGGCNGPVSAQQSITVNQAPQISTQPTNQTVTYGDASAVFSVTATGTPAPTYQWQVNTGSGFNDISGETNSTLTIASPTVAMNGYQYQVILTNSCGTLTSSNVSLTVNPLQVSVTADAGQTKTYGDVDPAAYTYTSTPTEGTLLANGDAISFAGALSRAPGDAGGNAYAINQGSLNNSNYTITYHTDNFTITPLAVTVTANAGQTKTYGDADPATYTYTSLPAVGSLLANGDAISFNGALSRASGEAVGTYAIGQNNLANSNYTITYNADNFTITPLTVTVTANAGQSKIYGDADPASYTFTSSPAAGSSLANGDVVSFTGALSRPSGEAVGTYAIGQNTLANSNYNIVYNGDDFSIAHLTVIVTADAGQSKIYGNADPAAYTYTSVPALGSSLANGDVVSFTGALSRQPGETVGNSYAIEQNDLANSNYTITYQADNFAITPLAVTVTANAGQTKTYGDADPAFYTYTSSPAVGTSLPNGDVISFTGALSRASGEAVGNYTIGQNNLANSNYTITYQADNFAITPLAVTVTANAGQTKTYGDADPATYTYTSLPAVGSLLANGDAISFTGALSRVSGEDVGTYAIGQNNLANSNYTITYNADNFAITPLAVTVTADAGQTKVYGDADPATYTYTSLPAVGSLLANGDAISFTGALSRAPGESAGTYPILQNSLTNNNYNPITYTGANFTITNIPIVASASAPQVECAGGTTTLTVTATGGDGTLTYSIDGGNNYQPSNAFTVNAANGPYTVTVKDADGFTENTNTVTVTEKPVPSVSLTSGAESDGQVICIGNPITDITYAIGGNTTGATVTALPSGLTGSFSGGVFTITGTPAAPGSYPYTVTTTGPCANNVSLSGTITVNDNATITLTSSSSDATLCINTALTDITYAVGGGATGASVAGLPNGLTGSLNAGVFTISGTPTVSGTFNYVVSTVGPCNIPTASGTITVNGNSSIVLTSAVETTTQTVCINMPVTTIEYTIDDGATGGNVTGLPAGVTGTYNSLTGAFTISGIPTESGTFNYTVTGTGPCVDAVLTGTITVNANSTLTLSSSAGTDGQTVCINNAISAITYNIGDGGTGAFISAGALPNGVTGSFNNGVFTITGTPTASGTFNYTITTTGPCVNPSLSGSITVNANSTISLSSASGSDGQTVCINNAISAITYAIGVGGTSASITAGALPAGVTGSFSGGVFTISGVPTVSGTFNYTITTGGPCVNTSLSGTITVNADATISLTSGSGSDAQSVCLNNQMNNITYAIGGSGTGATLSGTLPIGVTGSFSGRVFTISGIPTQSGVFNYTITTNGPCVDPVVNGTITVNPLPVVNPVANAAYCDNATGAAITFSSPTPGTATYNWSSTADIGFGTSGNGNISSFTANNNSNSVVTATVTVTATISGCTGATTTFNITVNPKPVVSPVSNLTYCNNDHTSAIVFGSPTTGGAVSYSWTSSVNIGFGLNGTGDIAGFTAVNNSINPISTTVTVTPSLNGCSGDPVTFTLTVNPAANAGSISGSSTICTGSTSQLGTSGALGGTWTSTNTSVATVNPSTGLVTGVGTGTTTIFYTVSNSCGASSASFSVSVTPVATAGTISGASTLCVGSSTLLISNGNSGGTWYSTSPTINISPAGMVTGLSAGTATVYYYVSNSCGFAVAAPFNMTISAGANPGTLIGPSSMCAGTANLFMTTGTAGGAWSSSNPAALVIDGSSGFALAMNPGTTTISYTVASNSCSAGSQTAFFTVTVNPGGNAGLISGTANICAGTSTTLNTTGSAGGTWSSGNTSIATVDLNTGTVTGVAPGNVIITYHVSNSCGTGNATFTMFVSPGANAGTISGPSIVCAGSSINLTSNGTSGGTWSSSNTSVAIVDSYGQVAGQGAGTAIITYSVTSACATSSVSTTVTVNPLPIAGSISGAATVCAGLSTTFSSNGNMGGSWSSSNTAVASVNAASGVVTGVSAGNATITYTVTNSCGTVSQSAPITVNPVLSAGTISGGSAVCMGSALGLNSNGNNGGTWSSSNTSVATVDGSTGEVTPVSPGSTIITYTVSNVCGNSSATQAVTVTALPNAGTISGLTTICLNASTTYSSNGTSGGTWSSSNPSVVTVDAGSGVVTGAGTGTAIITYTVTNNCGTKSATHSITVNPLASAGTISGPNAVCVNVSINLSSPISGGTWSSSSNSIATVNTSGQVTGVSAGNVSISYSVSTSCGTNVATYPVTVNASPNAGMISGAITSVCVGSNVTLTNIGGMPGGIWKSVNPARATVDPVTGEVTGVSAGNTIIAYLVTNSCGTSSANLPITVKALPNAGTISGLTSVCTGSNINLSASGDAGGTWTSNNTGVATVDPNTGVVTGVSQGTASIIYTVGSMAVCGTSAATYLITVNPLANAGSISGTTTVCAGLATTLTSNGSTGGSWSSSNPAVASVNSVSGVVTGISAGLATINYTVSNVCGSTTASATVTVNPVANAGTISGATTVCAGSNINLGSNVSGGTWSSSTTSVATIDANTGTVTGVAAGNTTITYTVTTSCGTASATYAVTVNPLPVAGAISGTNYLCIGSNTTLSGSVSGGSWSSSNTSAASVNPTTGVVTGIGAGSTTITYTVTTGCGNASTSVVVTVGALPDAGTVSGISTLCVGATSIFTSNGTGGGAWSSNNTAAATVDPVTGVVTGVGMGSATISYTVSSTCGSSVSSANITISALPNAGTLSGTSGICAGATTTLTTNGTSGGSWSSNNNSVATVNSSGVITGVAPGIATITYTVVNTCGTANATFNITINALPNAGTVSGATSVCSGVTTAFTSTGTGGGTWSSNNTAAATVDPVTGAVTGVAAGSATITYTVTTATCGSASSSANITINPSPDPGTISGAASVCAGANTTFTSNGMINGTWSSGNTSVATVNPTTGEITGVSAGTTTITYTITNGCGTASASMAIIVNPLPNAGTLAGASNVCVGSTTTYTTDGLSGGQWTSDNISVATVDPVTGLVTGVSPGNANITYTMTTPCGTATASAAITVIILPNAGTVSGVASVCTGATTTYTSDGLSGGTWSSATPSIATVDPNTGVVTGVSAGNATIVYTFTNSCGTASASKMITVNPLPNAGTVSGAPTVCIGSIATFTSDGLGGGTWSSSDATIASVDPNSGVVTGIASGNVTITYTSNTPCGTASASSAITVIAIPNAGVVSGNTTLCVGSNTTYTSSGMSGGTWSSVTPSVATVDANTGVVTGVSAGNATIVYTFSNACGTVTASQMITVNPLPNAGTLTGAATVCAGSQATYSTNGLSGGTWSSDNTSVATVDANTGVVIGVAAGNATITYTSTTPCGTASASASITVNPVVNAGTVSGSTTLCVGSTTPYTTNGTTGGTWSSVTPSVATVDPNTGVVTGVSVGNATIIYTVNGCGTSTASQLITVSLAANPGTINGPAAMCAGSSATFTRSGGSGGGTWTSSNTGVATVNNSGQVTAIAYGTTVISYTVSSGCGSNSSTVSVSVGSAPNISVTNITANTDPNSCSATITIGSNITQTGSPATTIDYRIGLFWWSYPIAATHTFYRGTTPVWVRASNSCGTDWKLFLVTVVDNQPPVINCVPNATRTVNGNSNKYSVQGHEFDATASDGCGVASMIYSLSGATVDNFEWDNRSLSHVRLNVGTTVVTWKATDVNGNVSTCSTTITVNANPGHHFRTYDNDQTLKVKVAPNPTSNYFTLQFQSESPENIKIVVLDVMGRAVEEVKGILPNSTLQIGSRYHPGIYIVQAIQGDKTVPLKLIKEGK